MNVLLMLIGVIIVYLVIIRIYHKNWSKGLSVNVSFESPHGVKDEEVKLVEVVTNAKRLPLPLVNLKFEIDRSLLFTGKDTNSSVTDRSYRNDTFSLLSHQKITRRIPVKCSKRGVFRLNDLTVIFSGVFMNEINVLKCAEEAEITVFPKCADADRLMQHSRVLIGETERKKYLYEDKFVFRGIRDYQSYDSIRDINWNATARTGSLMVNEYNETESRNVCILLNLEADGALGYTAVEEESISIAAGLAQLLIEQEIRVSLLTNGCDVDLKSAEYIEGAEGLSHLNSINTVLARIDTSIDMQEFSEVLKAHLDTEKADSKTVYVMISASRRKNLQQEAERLLDDNGQLMWIVPHFPGMEYNLEFSSITPISWEVRN